MDHFISIILPAKNEAGALPDLLQKITATHPDAELIVVNDGSSDDTAEVAAANGARVINHPYPMGNGAAIKTGARHAQGDVLVFMDADGQHDPADITRLLEELNKGHDMVVGARGRDSQASFARSWANNFYNWLASHMTGQRILDLTSGFRAVRSEKFRSFLHLFPNGFSYPTTSTMAFFRSGYPVGYVPIVAAERVGKSHIRPIQDGLRFLIIIFRIGTLYSPLKLFIPISVLFFMLGIFHYIYTFVTDGRFTNMSALLLSIAMLIFLIGLVSEQVTQLMYRPLESSERDRR
jgi:glycosyltransferase involved in cell wall biosynthesis